MSKKTESVSSQLLVFVGAVAIACTLYAIYHSVLPKQRIPIGVFAILAGVLFEGRRLSGRWSTVLVNSIIATVFSAAFLAEGDRFVCEDAATQFAYSFIVTFSICSIVSHEDKVTPQLTEGITLLQSIAVVYWVVDFGLLSADSLWLRILMVVGLLFSLYSLFHALTHSELSRAGRLTLSIWSSAIMLLFAADNIYAVHQNSQIEQVTGLRLASYIGLEFFLLGVSAIYIAQNALMLFRFLPGKSTFFNKKYFRDLQELKEEHIKRYSDQQVHVLHSLVCVVVSGAAFALNYYYQFLPRNLAIWTVFVAFPLIVAVSDSAVKWMRDRRATRRKRYG
jgi:hypothetical protein